MRFEELRQGMSAERAHPVTESDVLQYAALTGDRNPIHIDEAAARQSLFGTRIAHGMLSAAFVSAVLGMELPGAGTIYLSQTLRFTKPVKFGDTITARVEIIEIIPSKRRIRLKTICVNQAGETVLDGEAVMMSPANGG